MSGWLRRLQKGDVADRCSKEFVISCVRHEGLALEFAAPDLRGDSEVVAVAVAQDALALRFASQELRRRRDVVLPAVQRCGLALAYASAELRGDRELVLAAVRSNGLALQHAARQLRGDRSVVLAAVEQNGEALEYARTALRGDRDVVLAAVKRKGCSLEFAAEELRNDVEICCWACRSDGRALDLVENIEVKRKARAAILQDLHDIIRQETVDESSRTDKLLAAQSGASASMLTRLDSTKQDRRKKLVEDEGRPLVAWAEQTSIGGRLYRTIEGWREPNIDKIIKRNTLDLGDPWELYSEKQKLPAPEPVLQAAAPVMGMMQQPRTVMSLVKKEVYSGPEPEIVSSHITAMIEKMTGTDLDNDTPIMESGVDSLMSVELRTQLQTDFKVNLSSTVMFNYPTVGGLTEFLVGELATNQVAGWGKVTYEEVMEEVTIMENVMMPQQTSQQARKVMSLVKKEVYSGPEPELVGGHISSMIEKMTGADIDNDTPIMESGVDSLMSVELRTMLQTDFKVNLSSTVMFNYPTIAGLTDYLVGELTTNQVPGWGKVSIQEVMEEVTIMEDLPLQTPVLASPVAAALDAAAAVYEPPDEALVRQHIVGLVRDMTGTEDLDGDTPLMESGLDSLASVDLRTSLQKEFSLDLPSTVMFNYPTMTGLTGYLVEQMELKQISWHGK